MVSPIFNSMFLGASRTFALAPVSGMTGWFTPASIQQTLNVVTSWSDVSGNARNLVNADGLPVYSSSIINGQPGIIFDGVNDEVYSNSAAQPIGNYLSASAYTLYLVFRLTGLGGGTDGTDPYNNSPLLSERISDDVGAYVRNNGDIQFYQFSTTSKFFAINGGTGVNYILRQRYDGANITGTLNSSTGSVASGNWAPLTQALALGGVGSSGNQCAFYMSEVITYNTAMSSENDSTNLSYLSGKYGISVP